MTTLLSDVIPGADFEQRLLGRLRFSAASRFHPMIRRAAIAAAAAIVLGGFGYVADNQMQSGGLDITRTKVASNLRNIGHSNLGQANERNGVPNSPDRAMPYFQNPLSGSKTSSYEFQLGNAGANDHDEDQQNVLYGDGHVQFQQNPYIGVARDNIFAFKRISNFEASPRNADDSVLLPPNDMGDKSGVSFYAADANGKDRMPQAGQLNKSGSGNLGISGANTYGGTVVARRSLQINTNGPVVAQTDALRQSIVTRNSSSNKLTDTEHGESLYYRPSDMALAESSRLPGVQDVLRVPERSREVDSYGLQGQQKLGRAAIALGDEKKDAGITEADKPQNPPPLPAVHTTPPPPADTAPTTQPIARKVIRNGEIEFEIDSFDSAALTITRIVAEEGGYVATTNSEKLPNGKVKGTIVVRIPPDHLDTLVLKLRALGDLKSQNLTSEDVTKQYTDTASELRAAEAMQERLLNIIKNSQGQIKDLLAAEKELATWREKIEKLEGQIRYYDNLVSLSTLNISLFERDIKKADVLKETENVDMGVETDDVEASRASAIKAIDDAKGRIVESELKKLDAGQLAAKVVAEIPPDASGPAIDRLKQLGKVARLESHREQKSANDQPAAPGTKLERGETHLVLSLYNLANVAPRQTTNLNLAADDVETAYHAIVSLVSDAGGRVVTSNLNRQTDQQTAGVVQFEVKTSDAENVLSKIRGNGEVTKLSVTENPDTSNVTASKRGFNVQIVSLASMLPREVNNRSLATADVDQSYQTLLQSLRKSKARVIVSHIDDQEKGQHTAYIDFETPRTKLDEIEKALTSAGETYNRSVNSAEDAENVTDSKVQFKLAINPASSLPAREINALAVEAGDVDAAAQSFQTAAKNAGGKIIDSNFSKDQHGQTARLVVEVPFSAATQIVAEAKRLGTVRGSQQSTNPQAPTGEFARARIEVTLASPDVLVAPEHGVLATLRNGLSTSFAGLMWSLQLIVIGLCLVGPWVLLVWIGVRLMKRSRHKAATV